MFSVITGVVQKRVENSALFRQMNGDARLIEQLPGVQRASVGEVLLHNISSPGAKKVLRASIILSGSRASEGALAERTAHLLLQNDRSAQEYDKIGIVIFVGYDIGIASHWSHSEFIHTPREWSQSVRGPSPAGVPASASR